MPQPTGLALRDNGIETGQGSVMNAGNRSGRSPVRRHRPWVWTRPAFGLSHRDKAASRGSASAAPVSGAGYE